MIFSIQQMINEAVRGDPSKKKEIKNWYASGLGGCPTARYLHRAGLVKNPVPFDDKTMRIFSVGNMMENWLDNLITEKAKEKGYQVETQVRVESKEHDFSGKCDMVITAPDGNKLIYEFKSKNSNAFKWMITKKQGANEQHLMQLWTYLWLTGIEEGRLLYLSKDDLKIAEFILYRDNEKVKKMVMDDLNLLNRAWKEKLPPPPNPDPDHWSNRYCNIHAECLSQPEYLKVDGGSEEKVEELKIVPDTQEPKEELKNKKVITL